MPPDFDSASLYSLLEEIAGRLLFTPLKELFPWLEEMTDYINPLLRDVEVSPYGKYTLWRAKGSLRIIIIKEAQVVFFEVYEDVGDFRMGVNIAENILSDQKLADEIFSKEAVDEMKFQNKKNYSSL